MNSFDFLHGNNISHDDHSDVKQPWYYRQMPTLILGVLAVTVMLALIVFYQVSIDALLSHFFPASTLVLSVLSVLGWLFAARENANKLHFHQRFLQLTVQSGESPSESVRRFFAFSFVYNHRAGPRFGMVPIPSAIGFPDERHVRMVIQSTLLDVSIEEITITGFKEMSEVDFKAFFQSLASKGYADYNLQIVLNQDNVD